MYITVNTLHKGDKYNKTKQQHASNYGRNPTPESRC